MSDKSQSASPADDEASAAFTQKMNETVKCGFITLGLALGSKLGLFKVMCQFDTPATSQQIADAANCKERYVREWLRMMVASEVLHMTDAGEERFTLPPDHRPGLGCGLGPTIVPFSWAVPASAETFPHLLKVFKTDGPPGLSEEQGAVFRDILAEESDEIIEAVEWMLDSVPNLRTSLEAGVSCLDVGGGRGTFSMEMARRFPKSTFFSLDIDAANSERAAAEAAKHGLDNAKFVVRDVCDLPDDWNGKFAYVLCRITLHDLPFPLPAARSIHKSLKPMGQFSVVDLNQSSDLQKNTATWDSPIAYAISIYHCMSLSLGVEGSDGLGLVAGVETLKGILEEAGFTVRTMPHRGEIMGYCHLLCEKPAQ